MTLEVYLGLLRSVLQQVPDSKSPLSSGPLTGALKIIQAMHDQGINVLEADTLSVLQQYAVVWPVLEEPLSINKATDDTWGLPSLPMSPLQRRVHLLFNALDIQFPSEESQIRLLDLYATRHHWAEFWDMWRSITRQGRARSSSLYACMFSRVAETRNQKACMTVLRTWIPDMEREDPIVRLEGHVAVAVRECLKVVDPHVPQELIIDPNSDGEWADLWRRCVHFLKP